MSEDNVGTEHLSESEKEEIIEDRYWDTRVSHWLSFLCVVLGTGVALFTDTVTETKLQAFGAGIAFPVIMYFMLLSVIHLAKGIAGKVAEKISK